MNRKNARIMGVTAVAIVIALLFSYAYVDTDDGDNSLAGEVFIIHTNDSHGYYDENLGFSSVAALVQDYESRGATVFLLDAGDAFQGTSITMLTHGSSTVDVMNAVGYDLMVPGNHEFDYGLETYLGYTEQLDFPTICANLVWADDGDLLFDPYAVLEKDGYRLGVFGLATPDTVSAVFSGYLDDVEFTDPVEAASGMVETLQSQDVDAIVCLGHIGVDPSSSITSDEICAQVDGIDVFVDGHSHTVMEGGAVVDGSITLQESDTLIASTGCYIQHIGVVHMTAEGGPEAYLVDTQGSVEEVDTVIGEVESQLEETMSRVVGETEVELYGERTQSRLQETTLGDFVTDTLRELTGADIAVYNGGAFRASIEPGTIIANDVYTALPFENFVVTKTVTGQQVWDLMEASVSNLPGAAGGYMQVSGIVVTYDSSRDPFNRVASITLADGTPLDMGSEYLLAANDFVMAGGDGYEWLGDVPVDGMYGLAFDALFDRLSSMGTVTAEDVVTGRLVDTA